MHYKITYIPKEFEIDVKKSLCIEIELLMQYLQRELSNLKQKRFNELPTSTKLNTYLVFRYLQGLSSKGQVVINYNNSNILHMLET